MQILLHREVQIRHGLSFHALGGIDEQERAFTRSEGAADLVTKIDVAGRVEEVELVDLAVFGLVVHAHGVRLDGDAALALKIHRVQELILLLPHADGLRELQQPVGERGLAVVDVGNDGKITREGNGHQQWRR